MSGYYQRRIHEEHVEHLRFVLSTLRDSELLRTFRLLLQVHRQLSQIATTMTQLARKDVSLSWDDSADEAFQTLGPIDFDTDTCFATARFRVHNLHRYAKEET